MKTHNQIVESWMQDAEFRREYDALAGEFALFDILLKAHQAAGLTQAKVAERIGTKTSASACLEAGGGSPKHSLSVATLQKYAEAVSCRLEIHLVQR